MAGKTQCIEYTYKSNAKWILSLTPVAVTGVYPAGREGKEKNGVNYCFKSSCEINETLRALCWLKRSLPAFNRLFNHTEPDLYVCSFVFCFVFFSPNAVARLLHAKSFEASGDVFTNNNRISLPWMRSEAPARQSARTKRPELLLGEVKKQKRTAGYCLFFFLFPPEVFQLGLCRPSPLSALCFKWSVCGEKTGFHTHCHSFSLLIPAYLYFSIIFIFLATHPLSGLTLTLTQCVCL